jgi:AcrR family transcriptional regulator
MPRIWADTIDAHRQQVHDAVLDAAAALIAERGPLSVAMSGIAARAGIGRATLYKYFPDIESILVAWHAREFSHHLQRLRAIGDDPTVTLRALAPLIVAFREHSKRAHADIGALAQTVAGTQRLLGDAAWVELVAVVTRLLAGLAARHEVRGDYDPETLALWLLHGVHAPDLDDHAVARLVADSLAPPSPGRRA